MYMMKIKPMRKIEQLHAGEEREEGEEGREEGNRHLLFNVHNMALDFAALFEKTVSLALSFFFLNQSLFFFSFLFCVSAEIHISS